MIFASETNKIWKVGYVSGTFDMFHIGHLNLIRRSGERCEKLVAGVLADDVVAMCKGKLPVHPLRDRMEIIGALKYVDKVDVVTMELLNKVRAWERFKFDAMFSGDDHFNDKWAGEEAGELKALGAELVFFPYTKDVNSTLLQDLTLPPIAKDADRAKGIGNVRHIFPFDKVNKGERVVIYGAGRVGDQYARQLEALEYCEVVAYADTYAKQGELFNNKPCLTPEELARSLNSFDRIVVASSLYHNEILGCLRSLGVSPEKIV